MPEIGTSGSMSGDGKRGAAEWPKLPRPSSTLPRRPDWSRLHHSFAHVVTLNPRAAMCSSSRVLRPLMNARQLFVGTNKVSGSIQNRHVSVSDAISYQIARS